MNKRQSSPFFTTFIAGAGAVLAAVMMVVAVPGAARASTDRVVVIDMNDRLRFEPAEVRIKVGDTVEWRNVGAYRHTVTADPARAAKRGNVALPEGASAFDSGWVAGGDTYRRTFTKPGVYRYVCLPHEGAGMLGTIIVG